MLGNYRMVLKKQSDVKSIREETRLQIQRSRQDKQFEHLFFKRTKVHYEGTENGGEILTTEEVKFLTKSIKRKSEKTEEQLKCLMKAFSTDMSLVKAFLDEENSMWNLVGYLTGKDSKLQLFAAYCITNITSTEHGRGQSVAKMCSPYLIAFLSSSDALKQDLCATALGNIASDGKEFRELLEIQGILKPLVGLFQATSAAVIESAAFAAIRLCAGSEETITKLFSLGLGELLVNHLKKLSNKSTAESIAWLLFCLASNESHTKYLLQLGILDITIDRLHEMCLSIKENMNVVTALLRILGNGIFLKDFQNINSLKIKSIFSSLKECLTCSYAHIIKEGLWVTTNIIVINEELALCAINDGVVPCLGRCLNYGEHIQRENVVYSNITLAFLALQFMEMVLRHHKDGFGILSQKDLPQTLVKIRECANRNEINEIVNDLLSVYFNKR